MLSPELGEQIWPILVGQATNAPNPLAARIAYGDVAEAINYNGHAGRTLRRANSLLFMTSPPASRRVGPQCVAYVAGRRNAVPGSGGRSA